MSHGEPRSESFADRVLNAPGGENLVHCFSCGTCTASCPIQWVEETYNPRRIIIGVREYRCAAEISRRLVKRLSNYVLSIFCLRHPCLSPFHIRKICYSASFASGGILLNSSRYRFSTGPMQGEP